MVRSSVPERTDKSNRITEVLKIEGERMSGVI